MAQTLIGAKYNKNEVWDLMSLKYGELRGKFL